ncbi:MAG TPA: hypothetical protein VMZ26_12100 [Pyrinomonadaceae bacterium]|nr:hypothetical protein [Pyrinomonadaceae bacterium]
MKKLIQIGSILTLLVLFSAASTFAQSQFGIDVNIPFAFNVGDRSYDAGNYIVKFQRQTPGSATLSIEDTKTNEIQTVILNAGGDPGSDEIKLVFDTVEGHRYLRKVRTQSTTYAIVKTKAEKNLAKVQGGKAADTGDASNMY